MAIERTNPARPIFRTLIVGALLVLCAAALLRGRPGWSSQPHGGVARGTTSGKLLDAVYIGDVSGARRLLQAGANANVREADPAGLPADSGWPALMVAAEKSDNGMVDLLLEHGANPNAHDSRGDTPLIIAAATGKRKAVEALVAHGARVNARRLNGKTALAEAVSQGKTEIAELLKQHGATR